MQYQHVGKTGWDVSALSFGCMRFRDFDTAVEAVGKAIDLGVNYFDVAPAYGRTSAERRLGHGIAGRREKAIVTAKSSPGNGGELLGEYRPETGFGIRTADEARRQIERSMTILGVQRLDMYQLWAVHSEAIFQEAIRPGGFMEGVLKAREEGLFDYIGITTHAESDGIIHYLTDSPYEFDMVTLPFSAINAGRTEALAYCAERGIGVVAMNPLGGGRLARSAPALKRIAADLGLESMVDAALRFVIGQGGVTTALNGITLADHAVQGARAVEHGPIDPTTQEQLLRRLGELYENINPRHLCTACGYCGTCPEEIAIPQVLEFYTDLLVPSTAEAARTQLAEKLQAQPDAYDPARCTACRQCEEKCPNRIPVSELMAEAANIWPR